MTRDRLVIYPTSPDAAVRHEVVQRALRRGFTRFVVADASEAPRSAAVEVRLATPTAIRPLQPPDTPEIPIVPVTSPADLESAMGIGRSRGAVAAAWSSERVIPLENLLADGRGHYQIWVVVDRLRDLPAMLGALEHGADRVVVHVSTPADFDSIESGLDAVGGGAIAWELLTVRRIAPAGTGDRVIVDTTSMLHPLEGMLVGSAAALLVHVVSEAVGSRYTRPRPFRVNAGAAHSYTLLADGATRYLSELVPGDAVLATEPNGASRSVRVGRIKIERRPMVMIELEREGRRPTIFLQEAETVRLSGEREPIPTTQLEAGARIYAAPFPPARHLGGVVEETIDER